MFNLGVLYFTLLLTLFCTVHWQALLCHSIYNFISCIAHNEQSIIKTWNQLYFLSILIYITMTKKCSHSTVSISKFYSSMTWIRKCLMIYYDDACKLACSSNLVVLMWTLDWMDEFILNLGIFYLVVPFLGSHSKIDL